MKNLVYVPLIFAAMLGIHAEKGIVGVKSEIDPDVSSQLSRKLRANSSPQLVKNIRSLAYTDDNSGTVPPVGTTAPGKGWSGGKGHSGKGYSMMMGGKGYGKGYHGDDKYVKGDDKYAWGDDKYVGDDHYGKGYGMMMGGSKEGMMKGGMMGGPKGDDYWHGKGYGDDYAPSLDDIAFVDDQFFDDAFINNGDCEIFTFNETFIVPIASLVYAPDASATNLGTPSLPGTIFIWNAQSIYEPDGVTVINGTSLSGSCLRTTADNGGAGVCQFIFTDEEGYSINVDGLLQQPPAGRTCAPLAIVGGTGGMVGVLGEFDFVPVVPTADGDIFTDATQYEVIGKLGLLVCP